MIRFKKLLLPLGLALSFVLLSCEKEVQQEPLPGEKSPFGLLIELLDMQDQRDFTILISSNTGAGLFQPFDESETSTTIQAYHIDESNNGSLIINQTPIPFRHKYYDFTTDTSLLAKEFIGKTNTATYSGSPILDSFSIDKYCPAQTELQYSGLEINKKLNRNAALTVTWDPELNLPNHAKSGFLIYSEDPNQAGSYISQMIEVNDGSGTYTFEASTFQEFGSCERFTILYVRGYRDIEVVGGKEIDFQFMGHSWTTILFN